MSADSLDYPRMVQEALRGVVRRSLASVATRGLPGDHHFYLALATTAPGVQMPPDLLRQYPEQITIVLQHDYRDLEVEDEFFSVTLRFGGIPQRLHVPFHALLSFYDPAAQFALRFDPDVDNGVERPESAAEETGGRAAVRAVLAAADRLAAEKEAARQDAEPEESPAPARVDRFGAASAGNASAGRASAGHASAGSASAGHASVEEAGGRPGDPPGQDGEESAGKKRAASEGGKGPRADDSDDSEKSPVSDNVVSIEAFRRK